MEGDDPKIEDSGLQFSPGDAVVLRGMPKGCGGVDLHACIHVKRHHDFVRSGSSILEDGRPDDDDEASVSGEGGRGRPGH